ncbi:MAG: c-type cytochrome [Acidobacteriota bacterium]
MLKKFGHFVLWSFAVVGLLAALFFLFFLQEGFSARPEPSAMEQRAALAARHFLMPSARGGATNPVVLTPEVLSRARAHFADHCATCHGNDGRGQTDFGPRMYPRVPDMNQARTQGLSDGELYYVIENGIRLSGMPGFGSDKPGSGTASWELVHFIRHLPKITESELHEMERLNPVSRAALEEELADESFLGKETSKPSSPMHHEKGDSHESHHH